MRDPERIQVMLELIKKIWSRYPDLRFNQLIYNLQFEYSKENGGLGEVKQEDAEGFTRTGFDLFNLEDDTFIAYLKKVESKH